MDLPDLSALLTAPGPFVTVHVESESAVEQAADAYDRLWKGTLQELQRLGVTDEVREAVSAARGEHSGGGSRFVAASTADPSALVAVSLSAPPRRPVVEVAPLPHLLPLVDDASARVPHVVVLADHAGADVTAYADTEHVAGSVDVVGSAPDIRKVSVGGWSQMHYQHRAEEGWEANAREVVDVVARLADVVGAELVVAAGEDRQLVIVAEHLPHALRDRWVQVDGGRGHDGSSDLVQQRVRDVVARHVATRTLDLLEGYAQERGQGKRAAEGVEDVVAALRKAQVETLLVTTGAPEGAPLFYGPDPTSLATRASELSDLGVAEPQEGPMIDVLIRAALGTAADVQLVPHELGTAPQGGVGAVLRYADALGTAAEAQA